jgi:predicted dehydrogenase
MKLTQLLTQLTLGLGVVGAGACYAQSADDANKVRLITLDPGHFHASLVQKFMYPQVDPVVHVYAPPGDDVTEHLKRIDGFNTHAEQPTHWREQVYTGNDFLQKMLADKAGNVVVIAGNNAHKTDYILKSVQAGLNVLGDKPMAIDPKGYAQLQQAFAVAKSKGVLLYDIMTERFEITSILQRELAHNAALFGEFQHGTPTEPAITKESVHYFSKTVAGAPLKRPQWFFDVRQEGEGIVDVSTHLVDLVQWQAFPEQALQPSDAKVLSARRWSTQLTPQQFEKVTGAKQFPECLRGDVKNGVLNVYSNGEFTYRLRDIHARVSVTWDFETPPGGGDLHYSMMRGTKANLVIRQGEAQRYRPVLYIEKSASVDAAAHDRAVKAAVETLQKSWPGVGVQREGEVWTVTVPDKYRVGHEAHFGQVTENFLRYLRDGKLPDWEVPNMLTKYSIIMQAYEMSRPR